MRPLMICRQFLPVADGTQRQAAGLAKELITLGHPVRFLAGRLETDWPARTTIDGVEIERLPSPRIRLWGTWRYLRALESRLREAAGNYDIIHVHFAKHSAALAARVGRSLGVPVVCKAACAGEFGDLAAARRTLFPGRLLSGLMALDRLIAISPEVAAEWTQAGFPPDRIAVIPNGVDAAAYAPPAPAVRQAARQALGLPEGARIVLGVGRLHPQKGFDRLIRAVAELGDMPDLHLAIAGDGVMRESLHRLAGNAGLGGRFHLPGRVEPIRTAYHAADLFVLSSLGEGMSNALLEAMASGLDVVASRVSGVEGLVHDGVNGLLVEPGSAPSLAAAIRKCLAGDHGRLGSAARATIERDYTMRRIAERTVSLYEETIHRKRGGGP